MQTEIAVFPPTVCVVYAETVVMHEVGGMMYAMMADSLLARGTVPPLAEEAPISDGMTQILAVVDQVLDGMTPLPRRLAAILVWLMATPVRIKAVRTGMTPKGSPLDSPSALKSRGNPDTTRGD